MTRQFGQTLFRPESRDTWSSGSWPRVNLILFFENFWAQKWKSRFSSTFDFFVNNYSCIWNFYSYICKYWPKIELFLENQYFGQKSNSLCKIKILPKNEFFVENEKFGQKSIFYHIYFFFKFSTFVLHFCRLTFLAVTNPKLVTWLYPISDELHEWLPVNPL